jgi:hypothetical protein
MVPRCFIEWETPLPRRLKPVRSGRHYGTGKPVFRSLVPFALNLHIQVSTRVMVSTALFEVFVVK